MSTHFSEKISQTKWILPCQNRRFHRAYMYAMLQYKGTGKRAKGTQMVNEVWPPIIKELRKRPITSSTIGQEALVSSTGTDDMLQEYKDVSSNQEKSGKISCYMSVKGSQSFHQGGLSYQERARTRGKGHGSQKVQLEHRECKGVQSRMQV